MLTAGARGGLKRPARTQPIGAICGHGRRLSLAERVIIQTAREQGRSMRRIAGMIGVSPATISRELARGSMTARSGHRYDARVAHQAASDARARPKPTKLATNPHLRSEVVRRLNDRFSPEQVAAALVRDFPEDETMRVCPETIYQALYVQGRGALRHELTVVKALRSGRTTRKPQSRLPARTNRPWLDGARLSQRPAEADDRAIPGHWEGDLVVGPHNSGVITLVERASRFALLGRLPAARDSVTVIDRLQHMIHTLPEAIFTTLTWDQGAEMAHHATFTIATGCKVFFCDPHAPWQRGTNENFNGLLRDFYPKGTDFNHITDDDLAHTQLLLNNRPRKTLGWATPRTLLQQQLQHVALTG
jgi:IS30 family transposase